MALQIKAPTGNLALSTFRIITNPLAYLWVVLVILALYAIYRSYKTYGKTKKRSSLIMFVLVMLFTINLIANIFKLEEIITLAKDFRLNLILSFLPIVAFLAFDYAERKRFKAEKEGAKVKEMFKRYVNPYIVDELMAKKDLDLRGVKQDVTILFIDIRGFTPLSERLDAHQVVDLLNKYFKVVTKAVFKYNGTVDKFIGDAVMAIYNAPVDQKDHADRAVETAIEIFKQINELNKELRKEKLSINAGVGINTGEAVVGNVGTDEYVEYTAIGDTVNTASRLQGKAEAGDILISERTSSYLTKKFKLQKAGPFELKGKANKLNAFKVVY